MAFHPLSDGDVRRIHDQVTRILSDVGVEVHCDEALSLFKKSGCRIEDGHVYIPPVVLQRALSTVPATFTVWGRDLCYRVTVDTQVHRYEPMIGRLNSLDFETGKCRRTTLADVAKLITVADACPAYSLLHSGAIMPHIEGLPDNVAHVAGHVTSLLRSSKVIKGSNRGKKVAKDCLAIAAILAGGEEALRARPCLFTTSNVISPLELNEHQTEGLIEYSRAGVPIDITAEPQLGATSPATVAGALAQETAEILAAVVLTQLVNPGAPIMLGTCGAAMDMKSGAIALGGPEGALLNAGHAQMGLFYNIPTRGTGCNSEAKIPDVQAGFEKALTLLIPILAGINVLFYPGTLDHAQTISLESLLIDHEMCRYVDHLVAGIEVNEETLAETLIAEVGPGGQYLGSRHTLVNFEKEFFFPDLADRQVRKRWEAEGSRDLWDKAHSAAGEILKTHQPRPMPQDTVSRLREFVRRVEEREGVDLWTGPGNPIDQAVEAVAG